MIFSILMNMMPPKVATTGIYPHIYANKYCLDRKRGFSHEDSVKRATTFATYVGTEKYIGDKDQLIKEQCPKLLP